MRKSKLATAVCPYCKGPRLGSPEGIEENPFCSECVNKRLSCVYDEQKKEQLAKINLLLTKLYGGLDPELQCHVHLDYYDGRYYIYEKRNPVALISICHPAGNQDKARRALIAALEVLCA